MVRWAHLNTIFVHIFRAFFPPKLSQCIFTSGTTLVSGVNNTYVFNKAEIPAPSPCTVGKGAEDASQRIALHPNPSIPTTLPSPIPGNSQFLPSPRFLPVPSPPPFVALPE